MKLYVEMADLSVLGVSLYTYLSIYIYLYISI